MQQRRAARSRRVHQSHAVRRHMRKRWQAPFAPGVMSREERDIGFCARYRPNRSARPIQRTPVRPDAKQSLTRRAPDREAIAEHKRGRSERFPELN